MSIRIPTPKTSQERRILKDAPDLNKIVESTLYELGTPRILGVLPQLRHFGTWSSGRLTEILLDPKSIYYNKEEFHELATLLQKLRSGQLDEETERNVDIEKWFKRAELHIGSRDSSAGVTLTREEPSSSPMDVDSNGPEASTSGSGSSSGSQVHPNSGNGNGNVKSTFLPLVSIAITEQAEDERGPLQTALNTLFLSALHRTQNRNGICTVFLHNILALWTLVIATWTTPMPPKDEKDAVASWDPYTIPPVPEYWPEPIRDQLIQGAYEGNLPVSEHVDLSHTFERLKFLTLLSFTAGHVTCSQWTSDMRRKRNKLPDNKGSDWLLMLSEDLYPFRPRFPCTAGLVLEWPKSSPLEYREDKVYTVMSQITSEVAGGGKWRYCGEYRLIPVKDKTLGGHPQTLDKWADWIYSNREKSSNPTILEKVGLKNPSLEDIKKAIFTGTLPVDAYILQAVDYHEEVQKLVMWANAGKSRVTQPIFV